MVIMGGLRIVKFATSYQCYAFRFQYVKPSSSFNKSSQSKSVGESRNKGGISTDTEYAVLLDSSKSYEEQNRIGRQLFVSLFITGSVTGQKIKEEDLKKYDVIDDMENELDHIERRLKETKKRPARKLFSFSHKLKIP